jgi:hypothetical protein
MRAPVRQETGTRPEISEEPYSSSLHNGKKWYNFAFINRPMWFIFYEKRHLMCKVPQKMRNLTLGGNFTQGLPHTLKEVLLGLYRFLRDGALLGAGLHNWIGNLSSQLSYQGSLITYCISVLNYLDKLG